MESRLVYAENEKLKMYLKKKKASTGYCKEHDNSTGNKEFTA